MSFPRMVHKNGVHSATEGNWRIVNNVPELLDAAIEGFWSYELESRDQVKDLPYVKEYIEETKAQEEKEKEKSVMLSGLIKPGPLHEEFKKETGKKAVHKGKEVQAFLDWKKERDNV